MTEITDYINYREFLKDWIDSRKAEGLPGSNRWFAQKMGINSTSWLSAILSGSRNLNETHLEKLSSVLNFDSYERPLFVALVKFNQAKTREDKNACFAVLKKIQARKNATTISGQFYDYYKNWYNSAIRALIGILTFRDNYEELTALLTPSISVAAAKESVSLLERLGLIRLNELGFYELTQAGITTGEYEKSIAIRGYQEETLQLAKSALFKFESAEKDISTMTVGISVGNIGRVKELLSETRKEIATLAESDDNADSVYQLNMQLFPLSKQINSDSKES